MNRDRWLKATPWNRLMTAIITSSATQKASADSMVS